MPPPKERGRKNKNGFWKRKFEEESLAKDAAKEDVGNDGANKEKKKTQQKIGMELLSKVKSLSRRTPHDTLDVIYLILYLYFKLKASVQQNPRVDRAGTHVVA